MKLESVSAEEIRAESEARSRREAIRDRQAARLQGRSVDTTGDLFDINEADAPLFAVATPKGER